MIQIKKIRLRIPQEYGVPYRNFFPLYEVIAETLPSCVNSPTTMQMSRKTQEAKQQTHFTLKKEPAKAICSLMSKEKGLLP